MPLTLALDTSADVCAVALVRDGICLDRRRREMTRGHAEALVPMVQAAASAAGLSLSEIDLVGVTKGPGSFTGLRTGIAAARGFAIASGAPAIGVSSLQAVALAAARAAQPGAEILCVLDTRRADYFAQTFSADGTPAGAPGVFDAPGIRALLRDDVTLLAGNAVPRLLADLPEHSSRVRSAPGDGCPDAVDIAALAEATFHKEGLSSDTLSPLYLRAPEAKLPANGGRLKR
jgi:tRNA threonylcarbamoyladenosine biosynthesis protein TsaB